MKNRVHLLLLLIAGFTPLVSVAQLASGDAVFVRNEGQWESNIQYRTPLNGGFLFFENEAVTWHLFDMPSRHVHAHEAQVPALPEEVPHHAFRVHFEGAQPSALVPTGEHAEYHNYFIGNDPAKWAGGVKLFSEITYENLYPGIQAHYYGYGDALKYDFIVAPMADPSQIALRFEGADKIEINRDTLKIFTSLGIIRELPPVAYQVTASGKNKVDCHFRLKGNTVTFQLGAAYDPGLELIIDPTLIFSTHTGSTSDNWGFTATYDQAGNAYAGGIQWGPTTGSGYPITTGAFRTTYAGGQSDITLTKFNTTGSALIYSTYLGGSNYEQPHSLVVNSNDELIVMGRTNSTNYPTTVGAYDQTENGGYDIYVTKFSPNGTSLVGSTFIGGIGDDGVNGNTDFATFTNTEYNYGDDARGEVIVDDQNQVYVAAPTFSANFPVTAGAFKTIKNGAAQDGCIFKMNADLTGLVWSSFFGGTGEDAIHGLEIDAQNNVYVTGGTTSSGLPTTPGAVQANLSGGADGFIAKINPTGSAILACTYVGTTAYDQSYLIQLDKNQNIYVTGQSEGNIPIVNPPAGPVYRNASSRQFIRKYNNSLSTVLLSTVFGSGNTAHPNISPTAFLVDRCDNIYVTGWGGKTIENYVSSTTGMPLTANALQSNTDGSDFHLIVLSRDAQTLVYGSYLGGIDNNPLSFAGEHVDGGTCRFDPNGVVYHAVCSGCGGSTPFPTTAGVWSPNRLGPNCNLAIFKLDFNLAGLTADFIPENNVGQPLFQSEGCAPLTVNFDNKSFIPNPQGTTYLWDFMDNGATSTAFEPVHTFQNAGVYTVMLIITDPLSCNISDTTYRTITVFPPPAVNAGPDQTVCQGDTVQLSTNSPATAYVWTGTGIFLGPNNQTQANVRVAQNATFILTIADSNGCQAKDTLQVTAQGPTPADAGVDDVICRGGNVTLTASSPTAVYFAWSASSTLPPIDSTQSISIVNLDTTTTFYLTVENAIGCPGIDSVTVEVFEVFLSGDTALCPGDTITIFAQNGVSFAWSPNDGTISDTTSGSPRIWPQAPRVYSVTATSTDGCISTKDLNVGFNQQPVALAEPDTLVCIGSSVTLVASGGTRYEWSPADFLTATNLPVVQALTDTTTRFQVIVTDSTGCKDTAFATVSIRPLPTIEAGPSATVCVGDTLLLIATGGVTYEWRSNPSLLSLAGPSVQAVPNVSTIYTVVGSDDIGCSDEFSFPVEAIDPPVAMITGINRTCVGGNIILVASGGDRYLWNTGAITDSIVVQPADTGWYYVRTFTGDCASKADSQLVVRSYGRPVADFVADPDSGFAPMKVQFVNQSTGAYAYVWDFGSLSIPRSTNTDPKVTYTAPGEYAVTLIAKALGGCEDTVTVIVFADKVSLYVPNAFSPNGDVHNENFFVSYFGLKSLRLTIYSRWGMKVFESDDLDSRWDGTFKGEDVPEGVYVWVVEGVGKNELLYNESGTVTLFR